MIAQVALFALALASVSPGAVTLTVQKPVTKTVEAFPRITEPATAETAAINDSLVKFDARVRNAAVDCERLDYERGHWTRTVSAPFRYGGYITVMATDESYCGSVLDSFVVPLTFDLATGAPIDWTKLFPERIAGGPTTGTVGDASTVDELASPILGEIYKRKALRDMDDDTRAQCFQAFDRDLPVMLWLDANQEAVVMKTTAFPLRAHNCAVEVTLSTTELGKIGASPALIETLTAAHAAHAWTTSFPRRK